MTLRPSTACNMAWNPPMSHSACVILTSVTLVLHTFTSTFNHNSGITLDLVYAIIQAFKLTFTNTFTLTFMSTFILNFTHAFFYKLTTKKIPLCGNLKHSLHTSYTLTQDAHFIYFYMQFIHPFTLKFPLSFICLHYYARIIPWKGTKLLVSSAAIWTSLFLKYLLSNVAQRWRHSPVIFRYETDRGAPLRNVICVKFVLLRRVFPNNFSRIQHIQNQVQNTVPLDKNNDDNRLENKSA